MLEPNMVLQNRYRIVKAIGQGGMGAVYEAQDQRLATIVALKETFFSSDERLAKAFEREARLLAGLRHMGLPRVIDHFVEESGQFLVMEYIQGEDLAGLLDRQGGPFPVTRVLEWGAQLLDALQYLHGQNPPVVHRDIKPQNLKLTAQGHLILLDFGLAKGTPSALQTATATGSLLGYTPSYAPLEQIRGVGTDPRSDLYAAAATLYHLMTGVKPADALHRAGELLSGQKDPLRPVGEIIPDLPPHIGAALSRALSLNSDERPATAAAMRALLQVDSAATTVLETVRPSAKIQTDYTTRIGAEVQSSGYETVVGDSDPNRYATKISADTGASGAKSAGTAGASFDSVVRASKEGMAKEPAQTAPQLVQPTTKITNSNGAGWKVAAFVSLALAIVVAVFSYLHFERKHAQGLTAPTAAVQSPAAQAPTPNPEATEEGPYAGKGPKGFQLSDTRIKEVIGERMTLDSHLDASSIEVDVADGQVTLNGTVPQNRQVVLAAKIAASVVGSKSVHNHLKVGPHQAG